MLVFGLVIVESTDCALVSIIVTAIDIYCQQLMMINRLDHVKIDDPDCPILLVALTMKMTKGGRIGPLVDVGSIILPTVFQQ